MALDFYKLGTKERLFELNSCKYADLEKEIFIAFKHWTGL